MTEGLIAVILVTVFVWVVMGIFLMFPDGSDYPWAPEDAVLWPLYAVRFVVREGVAFSLRVVRRAWRVARGRD